MNREVHVRFCERRGVRFPPATHPLYAVWERGDWRLAQWADPEIELVSPDGPNPGSWTGLAAIAAAWRDDGALSAFEDLRAEV